MKNSIFILLISILLSNCREPELSLPENFIDESFWVEIDGAHLFTSARGNMSTDLVIINVHGGPALGAHHYYYERPIAYKAMEEAGIVVYYDQRGVGLSTGSFGKEKYTMEQFTIDLDQVVDVVRLKFGKNNKIFLFGRSWGGKLTTNYLLDPKKQEKITGWISTNGAHDLPLMRGKGKTMLLDVANEQISKGNSPNDWKTIIEFAQQFNPNDTTARNHNDFGTKAYEGMEILKRDNQIIEIDESTWLSKNELYHNTAMSGTEIAWNDMQDVAGKIYEKLYTESSMDRLHNIKVPTLFIFGEYDLICPPEMGKEVFDQLGTPEEDKKMLIYEKIGHLSLNAPNRYIRDFEAFISKYKK
ncbi:alpha/beta fold hydrolase [Flexithrix dorotheae]|uniref:alpha/beta fold hydrolase n=1 Tax=Flexithrix dorotheae TaxID=70993 RepID=UPI00036BA66D|nr:alpha/beta hydrolase [Flexithrix dorotheae]